MNEDIGIISGLTIDYTGDLSLMIKRMLMKSGQKLLPQLIPGDSVGTIWEEDPDIAEIKRNPTKSNWYVFLKKNGWSDYGENLVKIPNPSWEEAYAMAKTFTGKFVSYDLPITRESFCETSFLCLPKAMENILKAGYLDSLIQWQSLNNLSLRATLDYPDHYDDYNSNIKVFYWESQLDRSGLLKWKLQLHKLETETYSK
jgi:hypothetical protein